MPLISTPARLGALATVWAVCLAGCAPDPQVQTVTVPRSVDTDPTRPLGPEPKDDFRMLIAAIPAGAESYWFVRFFGPAKTVGDREADFDAFVNSLTFDDKAEQPLKWTVPPNWIVAPANPNRVITLKTVDGHNVSEMYVSMPFGGKLGPNVNRWRVDFLGVSRWPDDEAAALMKPIIVGGRPAFRGDLRGPGGTKLPTLPPK